MTDISQTDLNRADITPASNTIGTKSKTYPIDIEHTGIRIVGCSTLILTTIVAFFIIDRFLLPGGFILSMLISLAVAGVATYSIDRFLRGRWPSGRMLHVNNERIAVTRHEKIERVVDPTQHVNVLFWRFAVKKSQRVKKGWYVVAFAMEQDETAMPIYTFISPDEFENLPLHEEFTLLEAKKKDNQSASIREMRHAGEQRRLHEAELDRGENGAEMTLEHFTSLLETLQQSFPRWMPQK